MSRVHVITDKNEFISCEVFKLKSITWDSNLVKCPLCKNGHEPKPVMDIVQHGFTEDDTTTIMSCPFCSQYFALRYTLTKESE